jgi:hypothetical protein
VPNPIDVTPLAATAITASGSGASVDLRPTVWDGLDRRTVVLTLEASALVGILDVYVQTSPSGTTWKTIGQFTTLTSAGYETMTFASVERYVRITWRLAGTSATLGVIGRAEVVYADPEDLWRLGIPKRAVEDIEPVDAVAANLLAASGDANTAIPLSAQLPLTQPYPFVLREKVCHLAASALLAVIGIDPDNAADLHVIRRAEAAKKWFDAIALGQLVPPWVDATPDVDEGGGYIICDTPRGW